MSHGKTINFRLNARYAPKATSSIRMSAVIVANVGRSVARPNPMASPSSRITISSVRGLMRVSQSPRSRLSVATAWASTPEMKSCVGS